MRHHTLTLASALLVLFLISGLPKAGRADQFHYADCNGVLTLDNVNGITVDVIATKYIPSNPKIPPQISGSISINGISGPLAVSIMANVTNVTFCYETINKAKYAHAQITSDVSVYQDLNTGLQTMARIQVDMTQYGTYGQIGFKIYNASTGSLLAQTSFLTAPKRFAEIPLFTSDMLISF